jgi:glutamate racemase
LDAPNIIAEKLKDYLSRHPEIESKLKKDGQIRYLTTDSPEKFATLGSRFLGSQIKGEKIEL